MIYAKSSLGGFFAGAKIPEQVKPLTQKDKIELLALGIDPASAEPIKVTWTKIKESEYVKRTQ